MMHDQDGADEVRNRVVMRSGALRRSRDPDLVRVVQEVASRYRAALAGLSIVTGRRQILLATFGTDIAETAREDSFCTVAVQRPGEALVVPDARVDTRFATLPVVVGEPFVRFYAGIPVVDRGGYPLGALCIADSAPLTGGFDPTELRKRGLEVERMLR